MHHFFKRHISRSFIVITFSAEIYLNHHQNSKYTKRQHKNEVILHPLHFQILQSIFYYILFHFQSLINHNNDNDRVPFIQSLLQHFDTCTHPLCHLQRGNDTNYVFIVFTISLFHGFSPPFHGLFTNHFYIQFDRFPSHRIRLL